jgi:hypothetical protein
MDGFRFWGNGPRNYGQKPKYADFASRGIARETIVKDRNARISLVRKPPTKLLSKTEMRGFRFSGNRPGNCLKKVLGEFGNRCRVPLTSSLSPDISFASRPQGLCELTNMNVASGHTAPNTPDLFRTPKLTVAGPGQY